MIAYKIANIITTQDKTYPVAYVTMNGNIEKMVKLTAGSTVKISGKIIYINPVGANVKGFNSLYKKRKVERMVNMLFSSKKFIMLLLVMVLIAGVMGGCSKKSLTQENEEPVVLEVAFSATSFSEEMFKELFASFEKTHPNIKLKTEVSSKIEETLLPRIVSGDMPDVFAAYLPNFLDLVGEGKILQLDEMYNSKAFDSEDTIKETLIGGIMEALAMEGHVYQAPVSPAFGSIVINETLFEQNGWAIPKSYQELLDVSEKIKAKNITPLNYNALTDVRLDFVVYPSVVYEAGGNKALIDMDNLVPGAWSAAPSLKAFQVIKELLDKGVITKDGLGKDGPQSQTEFLNGKAAMVTSGFWFEMEMKDTMAPETKIGMIPFPANLDANGKQTLFSWYNSVSAWGGTKHKAEAFEFIKFILSYQFQKTLGTKGGLTLLSNKKALAEVGESETISYFTKSVINATTQENIELIDQKYMWWYPEQMRVPLGNAIKAILNGEYTPEKAAAFMEETATKLREDTSIKKYKR